MYLKYYLEKLGYPNIPKFLIKYLDVPTLVRLKKVGYFCGMDYASKDIYNFREYISRYDHSLTVALLTYKLTNDKETTLAGLFHDISTPCFSHVIDYMNGDFEKQESTEEYTKHIITSDNHLVKYLQEDNIDINNITNFKNYSVVDTERPKLCADRLDGVILTSIGWTKNISLDDIRKIIDDINIFINEDNEKEIGFTSFSIAKKVVDISKSIDLFCHSKEDNYMMLLLSKITKYAIEKNYISYLDLYKYDEESLFSILNSIDDYYLRTLLKEFYTKKIQDIPDEDMPKIKARKLNPLVNGKRLINV